MYSLLDLEPPEIIDPVAKEVLRPGDFMFTFDLKSGYHHVDIFLEHRKLKAFPWKFSDGSVRQNTACVAAGPRTSLNHLYSPSAN